MPLPSERWGLRSQGSLASTAPAAARPLPGAPATSPAGCASHARPGGTADDSAGKRQGGSVKACPSRLPQPCPQHAGEAKAQPGLRGALPGPSHSERETQSHRSPVTALERTATNPRETQPAASEACNTLASAPAWEDWAEREGRRELCAGARRPSRTRGRSLGTRCSTEASLSGGAGQSSASAPEGARAGAPALPGSCSKEDTNLALAFLPPETPKLLCLGAKGGWLRPTGSPNQGKAPRGRREDSEKGGSGRRHTPLQQRENWALSRLRAADAASERAQSNCHIQTDQQRQLPPQDHLERVLQQLSLSSCSSWVLKTLGCVKRGKEKLLTKFLRGPLPCKSG